MKSIIPFVFLLIFLSILVIANIYLSKRFAFYFSFNSTKILYFIFAATTVFMIAGIAVFTNTQSKFGNISYIVASFITGFMLYLLLSVLFVDLANLIFKIQPKIIGFIALALSISISVYGVINAFSIRKTEIEVPITGLQNEIRIVHLSDIHIGHFRGENFVQKVVDKTISLDPDIVVITGDLFDGKINLKAETLNPFKQISAPIYFVEGNHDKYTGVKTIKSYLRNIGVNVLENEIVQFENLQIIGLNHLRANRHTRNIHASNSYSIEEVLDSITIDPSKPSILLHHSPDGIEYAEKHGIDLYLSGHTHAGQIFPINLITGLMFPYNRGLHEYGKTKIFISQGIGTFGPPMRVGTQSEVVLIKLIPEKI
jgi:predicted MPP superfamily phosphohydrolase